MVSRISGGYYSDIRLLGPQHLVAVGVAARRARSDHGFAAAFLVLVRDGDYLGALDAYESQVNLVAVATAPRLVAKGVSDDSDANCLGRHGFSLGCGDSEGRLC